MGNCFPKLSKRNKVCPSPTSKEEDNDNVSEVLGRETPFQRPSSRQQNDMLNQLQDEQDVKLGTGGVTFTVDYTEGNPCRLPSRLADRLDGAVTPDGDETEIKYSAAEKELLAELFRDDILQERRVKARREVNKYDVDRRRVAFDMTHEHRTRETPSLQERRQKVKDMANENRKKVKVVTSVADDSN